MKMMMVDGLTIDEESRKPIAKYAYKQNKRSNHLIRLWIKNQNPENSTETNIIFYSLTTLQDMPLLTS